MRTRGAKALIPTAQKNMFLSEIEFHQISLIIIVVLSTSEAVGNDN